MAEMNAARMPVAAHERFAGAVQDADGQFSGLTLGYARLGHDFIADQHRVAHGFQVHGQRPVKQVPVLDAGQQHVAQCALMTEQQADGAQVRQSSGLRHAQAKGRAR
ncbi:hypothetical protein D3C85_1615200 [compost metagenome]